jgi:Porin PorA
MTATDIVTGPKRRRRGTPIIVCGIVLVVCGLAFRLVGIPALERLPTDLDETAHFKGAFTSFVDSRTLLPLARPTRQSLLLDRHIKVQNSGFTDAVVTEDVTIRTGATKMAQHFQYVMDRRSMKFQNDPRTREFGRPSNPNLAGSYRVNFPLDTERNGRYAAWNNETERVILLRNGSPLHYHPEAGISVIDFSARISAPASAGYLHWLADNGFPMSVTAMQLQPRLQAMGIDVPKALADIQPLLTAQERAVVSETLAASVPLKYRYFDDGHVSIEPRTGAVVDVHADTEGVTVAPDLSGVSRLQPLLTKYAAVSSVAAVTRGLEKLTAAPPDVAARYTYQQTPASSHQIADDVRAQIRMMNLLGRVPFVLVAIGLVLTALGFLRRRRHRQRVEPFELVLPVESPELQHAEVR